MNVEGLRFLSDVALATSDMFAASSYFTSTPNSCALRMM